MKVNAKFVSVWDGGYEVVSDCKFDADKLIVSDIDSVDIEDVNILDEQYILCDNKKYITFFNEDEGLYYIEGEREDETDDAMSYALPNKKLIKYDSVNDVISIKKSDVRKLSAKFDDDKNYIILGHNGIFDTNSEMKIPYFVDSEKKGMTDFLGEINYICINEEAVYFRDLDFDWSDSLEVGARFWNVIPMRNKMIQYQYVGVNPINRKYHILVDVSNAEPIRIYKTQLNEMINLGLSNYEEAKDYLIWKLGDYIKDLNEQPCK